MNRLIYTVTWTPCGKATPELWIDKPEEPPPCLSFRRRVILAVLVTIQSANLLCAQSTGATNIAPKVTLESLRAFTDADLLKTYESTALAAGATDAPISSPNPPDYDEQCLLIKAEILHRGGSLCHCSPPR